MRALLAVVLSLAIGVVVAVAVGAGALYVLAPSQQNLVKPFWTPADGGEPNDRFFRVAEFPVRDDVPIVAKPEPDAPPVGTLDRAVLSTLDELNDNYVAVHLGPEADGWVARADLTPTLNDTPRRDQLVAALRERDRSFGVEFFFADVEFGPGGSVVVETEHADGDRLWSAYTVNPDGSVTPTSLKALNSKADAFAFGVPFLLSLGVSAVVFCVTPGVAYPAIVKRLNRRGRGEGADPA